MNNETLLASALIAAPALLYGGNRLRLAIAQHIIDQALAPYKDRIEKFKAQDHTRIKPHVGIKAAHAQFQAELQKSDTRLHHAAKTKIPFNQDLQNGTHDKINFPRFAQEMIDGFKFSYPAFIATGLATDLATDAILNEALLRAFPGSAKSAGVGELSDVMLGADLKEIVDRTGVIDGAASFLGSAADLVGESAVVTTVETLADSNLALFSLASIAGREIKLINAGHSTPGESALYGVLDYGGRLAGGIIGGQLGAGFGGAAGGPPGAVVGGLFGALSGVLCARAIWRKVLKAEINSFLSDFKNTADTAADATKTGLQNIVEETHAIAQPAFQKYKQVLLACPDMRLNAKLITTAKTFAKAYTQDTDAIICGVVAEREAIMGEIASANAPKPNFAQRAIGANWIKAAGRDLEKTTQGKLAVLEPVISACHPETLQRAPMASLQCFVNFGFLGDGRTETLSATLPDKLVSIASHHARTAATWDDECTQAWDKAAKKTARTFRKERKKLEETYHEFRDRLQFLQRAILAKSCRLNPKLM